MSESEILATVTPSAPRRYFGLGVLLILGGMLIYIAFSRPPDSFLWQAFLLGLGGLVLWLAESFRRATLLSVELTSDELRDSNGRTLARFEDIKIVERGVFAFKPSNGFMVRTKVSAPRVWAPGLWWRMGKKIGVGGVTPASQTKFMAEILMAMLAERDGDI